MPRKVNFIVLAPGCPGVILLDLAGMTSILLTWREATPVMVGGFCARSNARHSKSLPVQVEGAPQGTGFKKFDIMIGAGKDE